MTGYCSNALFVEFLNSHDGEVVRIKSQFDFSQAGGSKFADECFDSEADYPPENSMYNTELTIPPLDYAEGDSCGYDSLLIRSNSQPVWSSGGTGTFNFDIDGFFRVRKQITGSSRIF